MMNEASRMTLRASPSVQALIVNVEVVVVREATALMRQDPVVGIPGRVLALCVTTDSLAEGIYAIQV
jgi:hypothetical protein